MMQSTIAGDHLKEPGVGVKILPGGWRGEGAVHSPEGDRKYNARCMLRHGAVQKKQ